MKTVTHNSCIETEIVCSPDNKNTYCITKRLKGVERETGIIVMLFPTRNADNMNADDSTLNHIVAHLGDFGFNEVKIINLFSRVVNSRISSRGLQVDTENMKFIEDVILADKDLDKCKFIVAWGNSMETSKAVNESKKKIIETYFKKLPKGKIYQIVCPERDITDGACHPLFLGIRAKTSKWRLMEFNTDKILANNNPTDKISKMPTVSTTSTVKSK
ncbi:MAG: DUF1643 domain-containing protein [Ruminococcaceae bacterium]|nr:DUF1643 domain-containing protein [Oscillospiraceae bacterium]